MIYVTLRMRKARYFKGVKFVKAKINGIEVEGTPEEVYEFNLKMKKDIDKLVVDMKDYAFPSPSIAPSPHLLPLITSNICDLHKEKISVSPVRIMEVNYGKEKSCVTFKDLKSNTIQNLSFSESDNLTCKEMSDFIVENSFYSNIDQIHIHTNGIGMGVYDHLCQTHLKERVVPLKHVRSM